MWDRITGIRVGIEGHDHLTTIKPRDPPFEFEEWVRSIERAQREVDFEASRASSPAKGGQPGYPHLRRLLREVAYILFREDLLPANGGYPFTRCAEVAVRAAGFALPRGKELQKKLKPIAVWVYRINGLEVPTSPPRA